MPADLLMIVMTQKSKTNTIKTWEVKTASIRFKIKNAGIPVSGTLQGFEGNVQFDPDNLAESSLEGSVTANSIDTANAMRDFHLRMPDYFRAAKFPTITMKSTHITEQSSGSFTGKFDITIKGKTKSLKIPFSFENQVFKAQFDLNRLDFGVGGRSFVLSNTVKVALEIEVE
ncbi:hypothetical protein BKI52_15470 [marine bacterium AO1-C]|nr:hypothetical protein BKI52_15470 [marine bacterium AO1-C]